MSVVPQCEIVCDDCECSEWFNTTSILEARRRAKDVGWRTGLKPTPERPSRLDRRVDLCPICKRGQR